MKNITAAEIMNRDVITAKDDMTVHDLAKLFSEHLISGAPVVDVQGKLVGVVSQTDIVRQDSQRAKLVKNRERSDYYLHGWEDRVAAEEMAGFHVEDEDGLLVRDIMTPTIFDVSEETTVPEMADEMIRGRIHRLLVTREGQLAGIVTTLDLLKALREAVPTA